MRSILSLLMILVLLGSAGNGQTKYRSGIFLHHSTGSNIWGPNGSTVSVPQQIRFYNTVHSFSGSNVVSLDELAWPETPWDNEWERWHRIFYNMDTENADIRPILATNKIVMIKSCFPSSDIEGIGAPSDTLDWTVKTVFNYKWHWRKIIGMMKQYPKNFFVIWTNAPLVRTSKTSALLADQFCRWAKDTLAMSRDLSFGPFPKNVYVFDFFHTIASVDGKLPIKYAMSNADSHPNARATELVATMLVREIFDAAIQYEKNPSIPLGKPK